MVFSFTATGNSLYAATHFSDAPRGIPASTGEGRKLHAQVAAMNREQPAFNDGSQITVLDSCIGCGVCRSVCPVDNFYLEGGRAKRKQSTCEFCLACAQNCPQKAIGLRLADKHPRARCRNPHISPQEIIDANNHEEKGVLSHDDPHAE